MSKELDKIREQQKKAKERLLSLKAREKRILLQKNSSWRKKETRTKIIIGALAMLHQDMVDKLLTEASEKDKKIIEEYLKEKNERSAK